jgi:hypothetical protein
MHRLDSVGFAIEDFSALRYLRDLVEGADYYDEIDLLTAPEDPRNLFAAGAAAAPGDGSVLTMQKLSVPAPRGVVMIRPHHFRPNAATAEDNLFQATDVGRSAATIAVAAHGEVTRAAAALEAAGVAVHLFEDDGPRDAASPTTRSPPVRVVMSRSIRCSRRVGAWSAARM